MLSDRKNRLVLLAILLLAGLTVRMYLGLWYPNNLWADEIFQTIEQAHRVVFGYGVKPWEYEDGLRNWMYPGLLAGVIWLTEPLANGSWGYLTGTVFFSSALSLTPSILAYLWAREIGLSPRVRWLALFAPLVWLELVYFAPKTFYETFTAYLIFAGVFFASFPRKRWWIAGVGGVLMGLACLSRLQLMPMFVAFCSTIPFLEDRPHWSFSAVATGFAVGFGIGGLVDAFTWGHPFHSIVVNYHTNLIENRAANWGTDPWYAYIEWMFQLSPVATILLGAGVIGGLYRRPQLAWPAIAVLGAHSYIGHKEYRFIYPFFVFGTVIVGLEAAVITDKIRDWFGRKWERAFAGGLAACLLAVSIYNGLTFHTDNLGVHQDYLLWDRKRGGLLAMRELSTDEDLCGVAILNEAWWGTGGYTYLHQDVPISYPNSEASVKGDHAKFNAVVAVEWDKGRDSLGSFQKTTCFVDTCILKRAGDCSKSN